MENSPGSIKMIFRYSDVNFLLYKENCDLEYGMTSPSYLTKSRFKLADGLSGRRIADSYGFGHCSWRAAYEREIRCVPGAYASSFNGN